MKRLSKLLYILTLLFVVNTAVAQLPIGDEVYNLEYDQMRTTVQDKSVCYHNVFGEVKITKDSLIVKQAGYPDGELLLGEFISIEGAPLFSTRRASNGEFSFVVTYIDGKFLNLHDTSSPEEYLYYIKKNDKKKNKQTD